MEETYSKKLTVEDVILRLTILRKQIRFKNHSNILRYTRQKSFIKAYLYHSGDDVILKIYYKDELVVNEILTESNILNKLELLYICIDKY